MTDDGTLTIRTTAMPLGDGEIDPADLMQRFVDAGLDVHRSDEMLKVGPIKLFLDGGGSLATALMHKPWPGTACSTVTRPRRPTGSAHTPTGAPTTNAGWVFTAWAVRRSTLTLSTFAAVDARRPIAGLGFTLIHTYLWPSKANMSQARELGVFVASQAPLQWSFGPGLVAKFGEEAIGRAHPFRSWLDEGVMVAGGSDGPGDTPVDPLFAFWQMQSRAIKGSDTAIGAAEAVTGTECLEPVHPPGHDRLTAARGGTPVPRNARRCRRPRCRPPHRLPGGVPRRVGEADHRWRHDRVRSLSRPAL